VELHQSHRDTMVAAVSEQGGLPSIGIDVELYTFGPDVPRDAGGAAVCPRQEVRNNVMRGNSPRKTIPVRSRRARGVDDD